LEPSGLSIGRTATFKARDLHEVYPYRVMGKETEQKVKGRGEKQTDRRGKPEGVVTAKHQGRKERNEERRQGQLRVWDSTLSSIPKAVRGS
jgi:hypothetical protein